MSIDITDTARTITYVATAGQTDFIIPFEFYDSEDVLVTRNEVTLTLSGSPSTADEYLVTRNSDGTGAISLGAGATLDDVVMISSDLPIERTTNFPLSGIFPIETLNRQLNEIVIMIADRARDIGRAILVPLGETGYDLRPKEELDGKFLKVDGDLIIGDQAQGAAEGPLSFASKRTGTTEELAADDLYRGLELSNTSTIFLTIPPISEVYFETGGFVEIYQGDIGLVTFVAGSGVTLLSNQGRLTTGGKDSVCVLRHMGSNVWRVAGDLS